MARRLIRHTDAYSQPDDTRSRAYSEAGLQMRWRPDWLAGHTGLEPPNPAAGYLIGFA